MPDALLPPLLGLLPVLCFLGVLLALDSYKLVRPAAVLAVVGCGMAAAAAAYAVGALLLPLGGLDVAGYSRYVAPVVEELLKALVVVALLRSHRIGFLVDAAIFGFAVGAGFSLLENLHYMRLAAQAVTSTWVVRGFGTALMHGGATALFAVMALAVLERKPDAAPLRAYGPGLLLAALLHSAFNHLNHSPKAATLAVLLALPPLFYAVFERSERAVADWLGQGFDDDAEMLALIHSGRLPDSPVGAYLHELKRQFRGSVVADVLCYLRLHTELALRAKGMLLAREHGFEAGPDEATRESIAELRYLERSIGRTGLLALQPLLRTSRKALWQLNMLGG